MVPHFGVEGKPLMPNMRISMWLFFSIKYISNFSELPSFLSCINNMYTSLSQLCSVALDLNAPSVWPFQRFCRSQCKWMHGPNIFRHIHSTHHPPQKTISIAFSHKLLTYLGSHLHICWATHRKKKKRIGIICSQKSPLIYMVPHKQHVILLSFLADTKMTGSEVKTLLCG